MAASLSFLGRLSSTAGVVPSMRTGTSTALRWPTKSRKDSSIRSGTPGAMRHLSEAFCPAWREPDMGTTSTVPWRCTPERSTRQSNATRPELERTMSASEERSYWTIPASQNGGSSENATSLDSPMSCTS